MHSQQKNHHPVLVIHGGAGTILKENIHPDTERELKATLDSALNAGYEILINAGSCVDAVETSIKILEDSPLFNAGKGSVFTNDEKIEMDASLMEGKTLNAGSVAAVTIIKNPISAARAVMEKSQHVMLVGKGAEAFAKEQDIETADTSYFRTEKRLKQLRDIKSSEKIQLDHDGKGHHLPVYQDIEFCEEKYGTVGAVALDVHGNIAAGTSTGGMTNKRYGRVGDCPIIGSGTYANNNTCAVSCTGHGEYFMRSVVAYDLSALMAYKNKTLSEAADEIIHKKLPELGGRGGLIALDRNGNIAMPFNTEGMYRGYINKKGQAKIFLYK